jgi:hypothetical protein
MLFPPSPSAPALILSPQCTQYFQGAGFGGPVGITAVPGTPNGVYTSGYGYINTIGGAGASPRSGQIVGRFTF